MHCEHAEHVVSTLLAAHDRRSYDSVVMRKPLPASLRQRDRVESIFEDIAPYAGMTAEQRMAAMSELCRWAMEQATAHPERGVLAYQDPRSVESERLWLLLVKKARGR